MKLMSEMHLRQPKFTYSACGPFAENKETIQKLIEIGDSIYIYQNGPKLSYFQHDMAYGDFKNIPRKTTSDKALHNKVYDMAKNQN